MQKITVSQFKRALAAHEELATGLLMGQSTGVQHVTGDERERRRLLDEQRAERLGDRQGWRRSSAVQPRAATRP